MEFYNFHIKHKLIKQRESSEQTAANNGKERGIERRQRKKKGRETGEKRTRED